jgi:hypothetical protein
MLANGFQKIQRADGVGVKVDVGDLGGQVVRGLGSGMNNCIGLDLLDQPTDPLAIANIVFVVAEVFQLALQSCLIPAGVACSTKEFRASVVVDTMDGPSKLVKMLADF